MPRKRRKLSKEMEAEIAAAQRKVELVMAMIHDIADEDTQGEYLAGFGQISAVAAHLAESYQLNGFCEETEGALALYRGSWNALRRNTSSELLLLLHELFFRYTAIATAAGVSEPFGPSSTGELRVPKALI